MKKKKNEAGSYRGVSYKDPIEGVYIFGTVCVCGWGGEEAIKNTYFICL